MTADVPPAHVLEPPPAESLDWARRSADPGATIVAVTPLSRSRWHANHVVALDVPNGGRRELVLRRWARPGWEVADPDFGPRREASVLRLVEASPVPAPQLVAVDADAQECDVPALLMTRMPGEPPDEVIDLDPFIRQLAEALIAIHAIGRHGRGAVPTYRAWHDLRSLRPQPWMPRTDAWAALYRVGGSPRPPATESFIHRDYHHGNTLWSGGRLVAVVDWTTGSWGPISADVAHARWNLAVAHGHAAARLFLDAYQELAPGYNHDPYWDAAQLLDVFGEASDAPSPPRLDRLDRYLSEALG